MERIKIDLPDKFPFKTIVSIRITDINYGGHVGNHVFLSLMHEARLQFLIHYGYSELSFAGTGLIMIDSAIEYKKELEYNDHVIISVAASNFDKIGFDIFYLLEVETDKKIHVAAKGKTGMLCYNYTAKKKVAVPIEAVEKLSAWQR